ncbi:phosphotransferase-histidine kinase family protein [Alcanivorax nanhaiticus]|uniref:histidine kinase n=1 Tax=Alcanivorax nanhaiticus TaxID=1177154 RepID=A0A095SFW0_9GAMM|nr:ATP-binding protein [Alcanivorax nanhaiticus]KGD63437.1 phosphotransferase-histidine kinase family protein [Alcanivorax nanhaiticus]
MALLFAIVTVPFLIAMVLIIQHRIEILDANAGMRKDLALFESGLEALRPLQDMRDLAPVAIHTQDPEILSRYALSRARTSSRMAAFLDSIRERNLPALNDQAGLISESWAGLTAKTGIPIEDVSGPFDNVNQVADRVANTLSTILYISDMSIGPGLQPNEVLSLPLNSFRQSEENIGLIRALALYVSLRGGYLGDNDARRLENAWQQLQRELAIIDGEVKALAARTGAVQLQQQWRLVRQELQHFLDWTENELILAPQVIMTWDQAYDRSRHSIQSLDGMSEMLLALADSLLVASRQDQINEGILLVAGVVMVYLLVLGLGMMVYRNNSRAISARAESQAKDLFLARMSHEIRTPLNGVIGLAELLRETDPSPRQREYITLIDSAGRTLSALINDVLDFAKIEAGKLELVNESFDLPGLLVECAQMFQLSASDNEVLVLLDVDSNTPSTVLGDEVRLRQVLINLLGNAVKFTRGGRVVLSLACRYSPGQAPLLTFAVTDTGIGLSQEEQSRLFQHFSQASPDTSRRFGGTGLGLSISHELVSLMGGEIRVDSSPGRGARFSFSVQLPVDEAAFPMADMAAPPSLLWDVQGNLADWISNDARFQKVRCLAEPESMEMLAMEPGLNLLINGLPSQDALEKVLELLDTYSPQSSVILMLGMRSEIPDGLPDTLRLLRRSVLTVHELLHLFTGGIPVGGAPVNRDAVASIEQLNVLVAEDNPINQLVTQGYLEKLGVEQVVMAPNGQAALEAFQDSVTPFDLVLMDLDMPVMDGFASAAAMRAFEERYGRSSCLILALSAHAVDEQAGAIRRAGMDGQIIKPLSLAAMSQVLSDYLGFRA